MTLSKLRLTLALLTIGFGIEGAIGAYALVSGAYQLPYTAVLLVLSPLVTLVGLIVLWVGRTQWNDLESRRFRHAHRAFGLSIVALVLAFVPVAWYAFVTTALVPWWVYWGFGAAVLLALLLTFTTYVLLAYHLASVVGKSLLLLAFSLATGLSFLIGWRVAQEFGAIVQAVQTRSLLVGPLNAPIAVLETYLAGVYVLLVIAYLDAFRKSPPLVPKTPRSSAPTRAADPAPGVPPDIVPPPLWGPGAEVSAVRSPPSDRAARMNRLAPSGGRQANGGRSASISAPMDQSEGQVPTRTDESVTLRRIVPGGSFQEDVSPVGLR